MSEHSINLAEVGRLLEKLERDLDDAQADLAEWNRTATLIRAVSQAIDAAPANAQRDPEARTWGRVAKLAEECGEAVAALIGATGQNPRKGVTHDMADVAEELLDVALTALAAWEHVQGHPGTVMDMFAKFVDGRTARILQAEGADHG